MGTPLRVLIVEDSKDDALLVVHELRHGCYDPVFERVDTAEAMSEALEEKTWDVKNSLLRWMIRNNLTSEKQMPNFFSYIYRDGLKAIKPEAVNIIRQNHENKNTIYI
ncbi:hypothetical protein ANME2D_02178 [Candidatus Methanoperedens nitroreducens]|uniref:Response regulatory domain-containing protein n=1 Tax=Candidatus Methanoperedens nitratireducens TaxID=1392998 RepID=A0A062V4E5_9EURY|nr:hypothetical protein [Candidatus Methanoperedens nitroreducens]KCZ71448.1 hypothetical protein ANME2D_02178 [Candidatus Methanoperedens nitroreducens]MDJ1421076.1 hypothetical protein [Candidatus Methanoperedens sp.]